MFDIEYSVSPLYSPLRRANMDRESLAVLVDNLIPRVHRIKITVAGRSRCYLHYDSYDKTFNLCQHGRVPYPYTGRSYKTLTGALNNLEKWAATDRH